LLLVHSAIKDLELLDLDVDSESCSFSGLGLEASEPRLDLDLTVAGLDTSLGARVHWLGAPLSANSGLDYSAQLRASSSWEWTDGRSLGRSLGRTRSVAAVVRVI